jgi:hypothetical protein
LVRMKCNLISKTNKLCLIEDLTECDRPLTAILGLILSDLGKTNFQLEFSYRLSFHKIETELQKRTSQKIVF